MTGMIPELGKTRRYVKMENKNKWLVLTNEKGGGEDTITQHERYQRRSRPSQFSAENDFTDGHEEEGALHQTDAGP